MPQPKTLDEHIADGTWRARLGNHRELLETSPPPSSERLARLQAEYQASDNPEQRRWLARQFQEAIAEPSPAEQADREADRAAREAAQAELDDLFAEPPEEVDETKLFADLDTWDAGLLARDLREGAARPARATWREVGEQLDVSPRTAKRLVDRLGRRGR